MRYIFLFLVLFVAACKTIPQPKGVAAQFETQFSEPALSTIRVKTFISYDSLFGRFLRVGQRVISANESSSLGFPYSGTLEQSVRYRLIGANQLQVVFPMKWEAKPQIAGISAGVLSAKSMAAISLHLQGRSFGNYQIDDVQLNNQWTEKPSVKVLGFPVQVGGVVDQLLIPKYPVLALELKSQLNQWILPDQMNSIFGSGILLPKGLNMSSLALDLHDLQFAQHGLQGDLVIQTRLQVGVNLAARSIKPMIKPLSAVDNSVAFGVYITLDEIRGMLASQLKTDISQVALKINPQNQEFECEVVDRNASRMRIYFVPILIEDNSIGIQVNSMELGSLGLMKSLFSKSIKRKITNGIHAQRMRTDPLVSRLPTDFQGIQGANIRVRLESIHYSKDTVLVLGRLSGDWTLRK
jgi:hypothetical protein